MMSAFSKRMTAETNLLVQDPPPGITVVPVDGNMTLFKVTITGPEGSPYEGGLFKLDLVLPAEFPWKRPQVNFTTKIFHPNVDNAGRICSCAEGEWRPATTLGRVLQRVQETMAAPNLRCTLGKAAGLWKKDEAQAREKAKEWTLEHAQDGLDAAK